jgi:signal transduction histidine kinase
VVSNLSNAALRDGAGHFGQLHNEYRQRIARDIHDTIGSGIALAIRYLEMNKVEQARESLEDVLDSARVIAHGVRRGPQPRDLTRELEHFADAFGAVGTRVQVAVHGDETAMQAAFREELFQILREALRNALSHAGARQITITVQITTRLVTATVEDDGTGFTLPGGQPGKRTLGLRTMSERAESLGGTLLVSSYPGHGTKVSVRLPVSSLL